jgi:hypothetical protein
MIFLVALIPATGLTVAGYVALFLSNRSEGALKTFGRYLGIWAFVLAGLVVLGGMFAAGHMHRAHAAMWGPHAGAYCPWAEGRDADRWERYEHREPGAPGSVAPPPAEGAGPPPPAPTPPPSR